MRHDEQFIYGSPNPKEGEQNTRWKKKKKTKWKNASIYNLVLLPAVAAWLRNKFFIDNRHWCYLPTSLAALWSPVNNCKILFI